MGRILAISDIHGQPNKLNMLLEKIGYNPKEDKLIILGDMVDRGTENVITLYRMKELQEHGAIIIKGNHDYLAELSLAELINDSPVYNSTFHVKCGGPNTYNEFKLLTKEKQKELYDFISKLPYYYEIENYIFVHAGINNKVPVNVNDEDALIWSRDEFIYNKAYDGKTVIFGHTPTTIMFDPYYRSVDKCKIWYDTKYNDKIGIDCGSIFGGKLACLELPSGKEYYI